MPDAEIQVYQAEWCPYSSRVREKLTELGLPWVALPVAAHREQRDEMRDAVGSVEIPVVVLGDGTVLDGDADEIIRELEQRFPDGPFGAAHREQADAHRR
ncbi:MAG TPA: glutaredoxin family protein [Solirubrobacteraceae bacterium]|nr:glutaredoxin family protein [Solirubrobacteraceae bacterium]